MLGVFLLLHDGGVRADRWITSVAGARMLGVMTWRFGQAGGDGPGSPAMARGAAVFSRACAGFLLGFAAISGLANLLPGPVQDATLAIFDFEAPSVITFGVCRFVKGIDVESPVRASAALIRGLRLGARDPAAPGEIPAVSQPAARTAGRNPVSRPAAREHSLWLPARRGFNVSRRPRGQGGRR